MPKNIDISESNAQVMQCMEVWGGNQNVNNRVVMAGLDAWVFSRPCGSEAGGDVHYVSSCATGRITRLLVADVSGHGAEVAGIATTLRLLMRRYVNQLDQSRFVAALNSEFIALAHGGRFATALAATFFAPTTRLSLSNAGHPPPLIYRARTREWSAIRSPDRPDPKSGLTNAPLGVIDRITYDQHSLKLDVGDLVLCYTDGLIESRDTDGRMIGLDGVLTKVSRLNVENPEELIQSLVNGIASLNPSNVSHDDVTVLLFRPNGLAARVPWSTRLKAGWLLTSRLIASLRKGGERMAWPDMKLANLGGVIFSPLNRLWNSKQTHE